jgi:hypothetical protein
MYRFAYSMAIAIRTHFDALAESQAYHATEAHLATKACQPGSRRRL